MEAVYAAVSAGCDSIYAGMGSFNARAYAENFNNESIKEVIDYCHLRGVKVYITFNILCKNNELKGLSELAARLYEYGADAFIVADIGLFDYFRALGLKDIRLNASTQMTVHNSDAALAVKKLGVSRIVLARELSLDEIKAIDKALGGSPDLEGFVHGALCVCYSGRCLYSSFIGGRSGNRGQCAQPCRMEYTLLKNGKEMAHGPLLSPKDIMTCHMLWELMSAGISAFKIEGRMKNAAYVRECVEVYRKYADLAYESLADSGIEAEDEKGLMQVFSRGGGFSSGYYKQPKGRNMLTDKVKHSGRRIGEVVFADRRGLGIKFYEDVRPGDGIEIGGNGTNITKEIHKNQTAYFKLKGRKGEAVYLSYDKALNDRLMGERPRRVMKVFAEVVAKCSEDLSLKLTTVDGLSVTAYGEAPQNAKNRPSTKEDIISRLSKTGNTSFDFEFTSADVEDDIYIPVSTLNELRREACRKLEEKIIKSAKRRLELNEVDTPLFENADKPYLTCEVTSGQQLRAALDSPVKRIYINDPDLLHMAVGKGKEIYYALPKIMKEDRLGEVFELLKELENTDIDGYLTRNLTVYKTNKKIVCDHTLGVFNGFTLKRLLTDYDGAALSTELTAEEMTGLCGKGVEIIAYGRLPLMVTQQCPIGNFCADPQNKGKYCKNRYTKEDFRLKDRVGAVYNLMPHCEGCFCEILSNEPLTALSKKGDISKLRPESFRLIFTTEDGDMTRDIIRLHYEAICRGVDVNIKKGHYLKGVR